MKTLSVTCVGMQHRLTMSTRRMLKSHIEKNGPIEVLLIREHDNIHDENAIKVQIRKGPYKGMHVGYLTRSVAALYAPALDEMKVRVRESTMTDVSPDTGEAGLHIVVGKKSGSTKRISRKRTKGT
jgi:hypothetical protein